MRRVTHVLIAAGLAAGLIGVDGHVLGFGSPDRAPLAGSPVTVGQVAVGEAAKTNVTVTARTRVTVSEVAATSAATPDPFTTGQPVDKNGHPVTLPVTLAAGSTLTVPVTFTPSGPGGTAGALSFGTTTPDFGSVSESLSGDGIKPGFYASPASLRFGAVATGGSGVRRVVIANGGAAAESVISATPPGGAFSATGLPAAGATIAPGASVTVTVTYAPSRARSDTGSLAVTGPDGTATVTLNGTGVTGPTRTRPDANSSGRVIKPAG